MPNRYHEILFTEDVKSLQTQIGSRAMYERHEHLQGTHNADLGSDELAFIAAQDSFYMASISTSGWPYVQDRGGPKGFLKSIGGNCLAFADFSGNHQYISTGNVVADQRVSIILMDYTLRRRIKLLAHANVVENPDTSLVAKLSHPNYVAPIERIVQLKIEAFEWNCPKYITERYPMEDVAKATEGLRSKIAKMQALLDAHGIQVD